MAAIAGLSSWYALNIQEKQIIENDKVRATLVAELMKSSLVSTMLEGKGKEIKRHFEVIAADDLMHVRLFDPTGVIIASSHPGDKGKKGKINLPADNIMKSGVSIGDEYGESAYGIQMPLFNEKVCQRCHGTDKDMMAVLEVSISRKQTLSRIRDLRKKTAVSAILVACAMVFAAAVSARLFVYGPIKRISNAVMNAQKADYTVKTGVSGGDELGALGKNLDSLIAEIDKTRHKLDACYMENTERLQKMAGIGEIASAIAHEIKNPLAGISGAIQVFAEDFPIGDHRREIIIEVLSEIERLDKAVRDLLNFARPAAPNLIPTPMDVLVERVKASAAMESKKHSVDVNISPSCYNIKLTVDPDQMQQAMVNVVRHSLQFMPDGGEIDIKAGADEDKGAAFIEIKDTGRAMTEDEMANVFKPYFTTKQRVAVSGLAMAISRNIIISHGGSIDVSHNPAGGNAFKITLPLGERETKA